MLIANGYFVIGWLRAVVVKFLTKLLVKLKIRKMSQVRPEIRPSSQMSIEKQHVSQTNSIRLSPGITHGELIQPSNTSMVHEEQPSAMDETAKEIIKSGGDKR